MIIFVRALTLTITDWYKFRKSRLAYIPTKFGWCKQFELNYSALRAMRHRRLYCDPIALLIIIGAAFLIGFSANTQKPAGCTYNATFDRWECCTEIVQTPHGAQCAIGARVTILNNQ